MLTIKVHVITLCQLNELWERLLIVHSFRSKTTYFLAKKLLSLVFVVHVVRFISALHTTLYVTGFVN